MKHKLTINFDNAAALDHFAIWLCEQGEQDYWMWMENTESSEENSTVTEFDYHKGGRWLRNNEIDAKSEGE